MKIACSNTAHSKKMRVVTWNVNGVRACNKKGALVAAVAALAPDVLCLQEIRCDDKVAAKELAVVADTLPHAHWAASTAPKGYSGVAILSREAPLAVEASFEGCPPEFEREGRVLTARFAGGVVIVSVYVPNSGTDRHGLRTLVWDQAFAGYCSRLAAEPGTRLLVCGDLNVAHTEMDIFHAASNHNSAGFTPEERANFGALLLGKAGLRDSFRELHPTAEKYSWFSYRMRARERNIGWRIDYVLASPNVQLRACDIACELTGSDHVPVWCSF